MTDNRQFCHIWLSLASRFISAIAMPFVANYAENTATNRMKIGEFDRLSIGSRHIFV